MCVTDCEDAPPSTPEVDSQESLAAVAHYIMMHYNEQAKISKKIKRKKKYTPKAGQYLLEAGLRAFGKGETAVTKELHHFNNYSVFDPIHANTLTDEEKSQALGSLIFIKEKRNGDIKARSCANGSVQREHIAKDEAASPTVALESVFTTATIDAREKREVVTIDIPGAFLHADNDDYVIMRMTGTLAELMAKTDPKLYRKYLSVEKGKESFISTPPEGIVRNDEERSAFLPKAGLGTNRNGVCDQPIRSMRSKQDREREPTNAAMACG